MLHWGGISNYRGYFIPIPVFIFTLPVVPFEKLVLCGRGMGLKNNRIVILPHYLQKAKCTCQRGALGAMNNIDNKSWDQHEWTSNELAAEEHRPMSLPPAKPSLKELAVFGEACLVPSTEEGNLPERYAKRVAQN